MTLDVRWTCEPLHHIFSVRPGVTPDRCPLVTCGSTDLHPYQEAR